eukprot:17097-Heterococcus_DN1.PRE.1
MAAKASSLLLLLVLACVLAAAAPMAALSICARVQVVRTPTHVHRSNRMLFTMQTSKLALDTHDCTAQRCSCTDATVKQQLELLVQVYKLLTVPEQQGDVPA